MRVFACGFLWCLCGEMRGEGGEERSFIWLRIWAIDSGFIWWLLLELDLLLISNVWFCAWCLMLYNRIAVLRSERSLSRQTLALEVGVNPQTIGFLERGDYTPSLELAFKISRFFKLPVEAVFSPDPFRPLSEQVYEMQRREA